MPGGMRDALSGRTPNINARKEENPDDVDEMPVPGGKLKTEMLGGGEMSEIDTNQTHDQERRAYDHVGTVESGRHKEGGTVDVAAEVEPCVAVFVGLDAGKGQAKRDRQDQAPFQSLSIVLQERVVRPRHGRAGGEQDQRVEQRQVPGIERLDSFWRPYATKQLFARDLVHIGWEQRAVEVGPEPRHEKHHLGGDEENHAVAMRDLDDARVISLVRRLTCN